MVLPPKDKVNIIQCWWKNGESSNKVTQTYQAGTDMISDIKKNSYFIMKFTCSLENKELGSQRKVKQKGAVATHN